MYVEKSTAQHMMRLWSDDQSKGEYTIGYIIHTAYIGNWIDQLVNNDWNHSAKLLINDDVVISRSVHQRDCRFKVLFFLFQSIQPLPRHDIFKLFCHFWTWGDIFIHTCIITPIETGIICSRNIMYCVILCYRLINWGLPCRDALMTWNGNCRQFIGRHFTEESGRISLPP